MKDHMKSRDVVSKNVLGSGMGWGGPCRVGWVM